MLSVYTVQCILYKVRVVNYKSFSHSSLILIQIILSPNNLKYVTDFISKKNLNKGCIMYIVKLRKLNKNINDTNSIISTQKRASSRNLKRFYGFTSFEYLYLKS